MTSKFLLAAVLSAASMFAATLDVVFNGAITSVTISRTINPSSTGTTSPTIVNAALLSYNVMSGSSVIGSLLTYCTEPQQSTGAINGGTITYDIDPTLRNAPLNNGGISAGQSAALQQLFGLVPNAMSSGLSALDQAAMQVAIWEIVRESSLSFDATTGVVTFADDNTAGVVARANQLLAGLSSATPNTNLAFLTNDTFQDLITEIPEPSTFAMMGLALAPLAYMARRRKA